MWQNTLRKHFITSKRFLFAPRRSHTSHVVGVWQYNKYFGVKKVEFSTLGSSRPLPIWRNGSGGYCYTAFRVVILTLGITE